jgi:NAD(P)-dependent dehydrogenase (short-subunit alcohol dehydrogenase family)
MTRPRTVVITGSASGIGAALRARLEADGQRVIGVDIRDADVLADLGTAEGRERSLAEVARLTGGSLDGLATCAGIPGLPGAPGSRVVSINYFGSIALLDGLRPLLATGQRPAAVAISSNSTTCQPGVPMDVVDHCLAGVEPAACSAADAAGALAVYPATKTAIARWARRNATGAAWAGSGITLNVVAPGAVETPLLDTTRADPTIGKFVDLFPVPVGRTAQADEIAALVEFVMGPQARFMCGSVLFVDGGTDALLRADAVPTPMP